VLEFSGVGNTCFQNFLANFLHFLAKLGNNAKSEKLALIFGKVLDLYESSWILKNCILNLILSKILWIFSSLFIF